MTHWWPAFDETDWSASFESYDQYRDDLYYVVTLRGDGRRIVVRVDVAAVGEDATEAELVAHLRAELGRVAATGETNTSYEP